MYPGDTVQPVDPLWQMMISPLLMLGPLQHTQCSALH